MKTFHRLMYENLTKDEYKELCRLGKDTLNIYELKNDFSRSEPSYALSTMFRWANTPQGSGYWTNACARLERQSQSDTINTSSVSTIR